MATYSYWCPECETEEEIVHGMMEDPIITCKKCGAVKRRMIKPCNLIIPRDFNPNCLD